MSTTSNNALIAKNTIFLYIRMVILMGVTLYTSRVVLSTLGIEDYGIYNVVGGFISMFAFLNGAMNNCTQRYITYALGKGDEFELKKVFSNSIITHFIIAIAIVLLSETIGLWFVIEKLVIPGNRFVAAMVVYQCSILSTFFVIMGFPFNADIIAHEKMSAFAYISIYEAIAKLLIVYLLIIGNVDKLILYSVLLLIIQVTVISIYVYYCKKRFVEATLKWNLDKKLLKEMVSFTSWNLWGGLAAALFGQGINILLNLFFGPVINAARGIAVQVQSAVQQFSSNFQIALNPQIIKNYANSDLDTMHSLIYRSSRFTFYLMLLIILPVIIEIDMILSFWLNEVPHNTSIFVSFMLLIAMVDAVSNPLMVSAAATGRVKVYQSVIGGLLLLIVPISYVVLKFGGAPYTVFMVHFFVAIFAFVARLFIIRPLIRLSIYSYLKNVLYPCILVLIPSVLSTIVLKSILPNNAISTIIVVFASCVFVLIYSFFLGSTQGEKAFIIDKIRIILNK